MLRSTIIRWAFALSLVAVAVACSDAELTYGGPLALSVTSNEPVEVTDSLIVEYSVEGSSLLGIEVLWGDETVDSVFFGGAQTAGGRLAHLYDADGSYVVTATVTDALQGTADRQITVTVSP